MTKMIQEGAWSEIDDCVRSWQGSDLTRAEVLDRLFGLPTLEHQLELLSKLSPDFADEARASVADLPTSIDEWSPGAHVPLSGIFSKEPDVDFDKQSRLYRTAKLQRMRDLQEYFARLDRPS